jgi:hypothetical protein
VGPTGTGKGKGAAAVQGVVAPSSAGGGGSEGGQQDQSGAALHAAASNSASQRLPLVRVEYEALPPCSEHLFLGRLEGPAGKDRSQRANFYFDTCVMLVVADTWG